MCIFRFSPVADCLNPCGEPTFPFVLFPCYAQPAHLYSFPPTVVFFLVAPNGQIGPQKTGRAEAPTGAQMQKVVDFVNDTIAKDLPCFRFTMARKDAEATYGPAM